MGRKESFPSTSKYKLYIHKLYIQRNHKTHEILQFFSMMTTFQVYFYFFLTFAKNRQYARFLSRFFLFSPTFCKNRRMNRRKGANFNSRKRIHECDHCGLEFTTKYRLQQHLKTSTNCKKKYLFLVIFVIM